VDHHNDFDYVCTFDERLAGRDNFVFYPYGTTWIHDGEKAIYLKSKNLSMIASVKRMTESQRLRHAVVDRYRSRIDGLFGTAYRPIKDKYEGLAYYRYSIAIENCDINSYFSEKLMDCFLTGTVPIYWGFSKVTDFFDPAGVITFRNVEDLQAVIDGLSDEDYKARLPAVQRNYEKAMQYVSFEKYLWESCLSKFFK
jgi:hypothetical protein